MDELKAIACRKIDENDEKLRELNRRIWENPETNYKEVKSHNFLTDFFTNNDFTVTPHWNLQTAFRADYGRQDNGPCVGVICEYDALPDVGHACGHNLIAEAGAGAALGIQAALAANNQLGRLVVYGTPAEEMGGGKIAMIEKGCFRDSDFCMMVHPFPHDAAFLGSLDTKLGFITYKGYSAHASLFPWQGINALDAAVMAYNSISTLRQQMKPSWRVHGVILNGGVKSSIIPSITKLEYCLRTPNKTDMGVLASKATDCFQAAAKATGCSVDIDWVHLSSYQDLNINPTLAQIYKNHAASLGVKFSSREEEDKMPLGATDMGNISHIVPSIQPFYSIGTSSPNHSVDFAAAAATEIAHERTIIAAKSMAMTAIDVMGDADILSTVKQQFSQSH